MANKTKNWLRLDLSAAHSRKEKKKSMTKKIRELLLEPNTESRIKDKPSQFIHEILYMKYHENRRYISVLEVMAGKGEFTSEVLGSMERPKPTVYIHNVSVDLMKEVDYIISRPKPKAYVSHLVDDFIKRVGGKPAPIKVKKKLVGDVMNISKLIGEHALGVDVVLHRFGIKEISRNKQNPNLNQQERFFNEIRRVLKKHGIFAGMYMYVPNDMRMGDYTAYLSNEDHRRIHLWLNFLYNALYVLAYVKRHPNEKEEIMKRLAEMDKTVEKEIMKNISGVREDVNSYLYDVTPPHIEMLIDNDLFDITHREIPYFNALIEMLQSSGFENVYTMKTSKEVFISEWYERDIIDENGMEYLVDFIHKTFNKYPDIISEVYKIKLNPKETADEYLNDANISLPIVVFVAEK